MTVGIMPNGEFADVSDAVLWEVLVCLSDTPDIWYNVAGINPNPTAAPGQKGWTSHRKNPNLILLVQHILSKKKQKKTKNNNLKTKR